MFLVIVVGLALALTGAVLMGGPPAPAVSAGPIMEDPSLIVSTIVQGLTTPTTLALIDLDELLVLEKDTGKVQHIRNGVTVGTALDLAVNFFSERGALGIALHPRFATNGFVYIFWTWKGSGSGPQQIEGGDTKDPAQVPLLGNRLDRFRWNGASLAFDRRLLSFPSRTVKGTLGRTLGNHNGGVLVFGPDGKLYILVGDQNLRGKLQNISGGPMPRDEDFAGVIARLNDDGTTPGDNPFFAVGQAIGGQAGRNIQRIFAYGIRNSFGMAFDPLGGGLWIEENGDDAFDEISRVPAGFNSRWIQMMGSDARYQQYRQIETASPDGLDTPSFTPQDLALTLVDALRRLFALPGSRPRNPAFSWKFPVAPAGIGFLTSNALGPDMQGGLFVGDVETASLYQFQLSGTRRSLVFTDPALADRVADNKGHGDLKESESLTVGRGFGIVTDIETGLNGNLFVVSFSDGKVYEISRR